MKKWFQKIASRLLGKKRKLANIIDGWYNYTFPNEYVEAIAKRRAEICSECPFAQVKGYYEVIADNKTKKIQGMACGKCECALSAKVRSMDDWCPDGKW